MSKLSAEEISIKHYPDSDFEECQMGCMRCDKDDCESKTLSRLDLQKDIQAFATARLEAYKAELVELLKEETKKAREKGSYALFTPKELLHYLNNDNES